MKGAIFDMDGILFDTERIYQETWNEIAEERKISLADGFARAVSGSSGIHMRQVIQQYYNVADGAEIIAECMRRVKEKLDIDVPVKRGVPEILEFFRKRQIRMAVASSSSLEQIRSNLEKAQIHMYFDKLVSGNEVAHGKPAPDIFLLAAKRLDCRPGECYVFEDSENGVRSGSSAGCATIMIPDLFEPSEEIRTYCRAVCRDFFQVIRETEKEI